MSGSFDELNVRQHLFPLQFDVASENDVVTPEFKKAGNKLVLFAIEKDEYDLPNYEQVKKLYGQIHEAVRNGQIVSSMQLAQAVSGARVLDRALLNSSCRILTMTLFWQLSAKSLACLALS